MAGWAAPWLGSCRDHGARRRWLLHAAPRGRRQGPTHPGVCDPGRLLKEHKVVTGGEVEAGCTGGEAEVGGWGSWQVHRGRVWWCTPAQGMCRGLCFESAAGRRHQLSALPVPPSHTHTPHTPPPPHTHTHTHTQRPPSTCGAVLRSGCGVVAPPLALVRLYVPVDTAVQLVPAGGHNSTRQAGLVAAEACQQVQPPLETGSRRAANIGRRLACKRTSRGAGKSAVPGPHFGTGGANA